MPYGTAATLVSTNIGSVVQGMSLGDGKVQYPSAPHRRCVGPARGAPLEVATARAIAVRSAEVTTMSSSRWIIIGVRACVAAKYRTVHPITALSSTKLKCLILLRSHEPQPSAVACSICNLADKLAFDACAISISLALPSAKLSERRTATSTWWRVCMRPNEGITTLTSSALVRWTDSACLGVSKPSSEFGLGRRAHLADVAARKVAAGDDQKNRGTGLRCAWSARDACPLLQGLCASFGCSTAR